VLFEIIGGVPKHELVIGNPSCASEELSHAIKRRATREPLQYVIGKVDFFRESYNVTPDCLIPRSDTEILVEYAVKNIPDGKFFLDLCTGSGCVAISTLRNTRGTRAEAVDVSEKALEIAKSNATKNGVSERLIFTQADLTLHFSPTERPFAILSNPPYVSLEAYESSQPEIAFEPKIAFVGGNDGGDFYRTLIPLCKNLIDEDGFLAFEIGFDQAPLSQKLAEENLLSVEILKDFSGNDRVAVFRKIK
jgi:release factor glutamine methyltransferase